MLREYKFPTRRYGNVVFPAGRYEALRVEIGDAEGQNWWCVMFPPLCFVDVKHGLTDEKTKRIGEISDSGGILSCVQQCK